MSLYSESQRHLLLSAHKMSGGSVGRPVDTTDLFLMSVGSVSEQAMADVKALVGSGLLVGSGGTSIETLLPGRVALTPMGYREVAIDIERETAKNQINIGTNVNSPISQVSGTSIGSSIDNRIDSGADSIIALLKLIEVHAPELNLPTAECDKLLANVAYLKNSRAEVEGNTPIYREIIKSIRNILENAAGNVIGSSPIWSHIVSGIS